MEVNRAQLPVCERSTQSTHSGFPQIKGHITSKPSLHSWKTRAGSIIWKVSSSAQSGMLGEQVNVVVIVVEGVVTVTVVGETQSGFPQINGHVTSKPSLHSWSTREGSISRKVSSSAQSGMLGVQVIVVVLVVDGVVTVTQLGSPQTTGQDWAAPSMQSCTTSSGSIIWKMTKRAHSGIWSAQGAKVVDVEVQVEVVEVVLGGVGTGQFPGSDTVPNSGARFNRKTFWLEKPLETWLETQLEFPLYYTEEKGSFQY